MGMFDEVKCKYKLPIEGFSEHIFQTKDTPDQSLDLYEIREDGTLWHEEYDIEDHSDPNAEGIMRFIGCMARVNKRFVFVPLTGEIRFYGFPTDNYEDGGWIEFSTYFVDGKIREIHLIENRPPRNEGPQSAS